MSSEITGELPVVRQALQALSLTGDHPAQDHRLEPVTTNLHLFLTHNKATYLSSPNFRPSCRLIIGQEQKMASEKLIAPLPSRAELVEGFRAMLVGTSSHFQP